MGNYDFIKNFLGKSANLGKDVHDMTNREAYSCPFGTITPISFIKVVPNETYEASIGAGVQTAPMREDNFARINNNLKAVFVPMSSLCRDYLSLTSASRGTRKDSLLNFPVRDIRFKLVDVISIIAPLYMFQQWVLGMRGSFGEKFDDLLIGHETGDSRLYLYLKSGNGTETIVNPSSVDGADKYVDCLNKGLISFRNDDSATGRVPLSSFSEKLNSFASLSGNLFCSDVLRILDNLGFGNFIPFVQNLFDYYLNAPISGVGSYPPISLYFEGDSSFIDFFDLARSLRNETVVSSPFYFVDSNVSLIPIIAYQYYVSMCEMSNYRHPSSGLVTIDGICSYFANNSSWSEFQLGSDDSLVLQLDFHVFTNSAGFSEAFYASLDLRLGHKGLGDSPVSALFIHLFSLSNPLLQQDLYTTSQLSVVEGSVPGTTPTALTGDLVKTMNEVSALYKLRQDLLRAGVRRDKQMQSIFGVSGNQHVVEPVKILDSSSTPLNINGLVNMADTDVAPLGARGARGDGKNGIKFKARFEDFGIIFIVQSFTCDAFYENFMVDQSWQIGPESWFMPHFNNLGLEPIRTVDLSVYKSLSADDHSILNNRNEVIGFSSHYWRLKTRVDKLHGLFTNFAFAPSSIADVDYYDRNQTLKVMRLGNGAFGGFLPSLIQQQVDLYDPELSLYYNPFMVNNLFVQMVNGAEFNDQSFDQFRCVISISCKKISPMPKIGLFKLLVG